ncbi:MAG: AMP-binding protein [Hyphomicrobiales bacterium]|nr:AMP-binding protein [Hyphomicrobiales bacterium]
MVAGPSIPPRESCVLGPLLERWAREKPEDSALIFEDGPQWTWAELLQRTRQVAAGLKAMGVNAGDHVLSWQPNNPEAILTWFALNYIGAVYIPMNTAYKGKLLQNLVQLSDAKLMVCHADLAARLNAIDPGLTLSDVVVTGGSCKLDQLATHDETCLFGPCDANQALDLEERGDPWDTMYVIFTSGTTGPSKAVLSSYVQTYACGAEAFDFLCESDRILVNLPLFHVGGTVLVAIGATIGCSCVIVDGFSTDRFWPVIRHFEITTTCLLGAMTPFLLKQPPAPDDKDHPLRHVVTVPWNEDAAALARRFGLEMRTSYNMTETCTPLMSGPNPDALGTCGKPRPGIEVRVVDEHDKIVPPGDVGELIIRTDRPWSLNSGYYKNPEATAHAWRNGWFHTGDAFRYDEDNNFYFVDRIKDAIRRRGENISSFEVESEVSAYPRVLDVAAIPVPSQFSEDEVMIIVSPAPGQSIDPEELFWFLEERMAHFMLPSYIRVVKDLPKTPTQKIRKDLLRDDGVTADTWSRDEHGIRVRRTVQGRKS